MYVIDPGDEPVKNILPVAPPPPPPEPSPPPPVIPPTLPPPSPALAVSAPAEPRNANGETLAEAEAAVLAEVAAGALGADALARHPLPQGTSTAEALRFLASLPQTTYQVGEPGGTITGPPVDTLPPGAAPGAGGGGSGVNPPAQPPLDFSGETGDDRTLESAYQPANLHAVWRDLVDVFKTELPKKRSAVISVFDTPKGLFQ